MGSDYQHKVLVVDDEKQVGKTVCRILKKEGLEPVFADGGENAIRKIKKTNKPFSLIISDQKMDGMTGTEFLEQAKLLAPDTVRFLLTGYTEMDIIINAVNKGAVQRYITKPWDHNDFVKTIWSGIGLYEIVLEDKKLIRLAKKQNAKLYELNCELMETSKHHDKEIQELDQEIEKVKKSLEKLSSTPAVSSKTVLTEIENFIKTDTNIDTEKLELVFSNTISVLFDQFKDLSYRNGFEMPEI